MGFNVYLPAGTMVGNIEFNKAYSTVKVLHNIQRCVLYLHDIQRCVSRYMSPLISLIYFVKNYAKEAHLRGIFRTQPGI